MENVICDFYLGVAASKTEQIPEIHSDITGMLSNQQTTSFQSDMSQPQTKLHPETL